MPRSGRGTGPRRRPNAHQHQCFAVQHGKAALRREIFATAARRHRVPIVYVNQVGGNDSLVFDGSSFAMTADGNVAASARFVRRGLGLFRY